MNLKQFIELSIYLYIPKTKQRLFCNRFKSKLLNLFAYYFPSTNCYIKSYNYDHYKRY